MSNPPAEVDRPGKRVARWGKIVGLLWRLSPGRIVMAVISSLLISVVPAAQLQVSALAVQSVVDAIGQPSSSWAGRVAILGSLVVALAVVGHLGAAWYQYLDAVIRLRLTTAIGEQVMLKGIQMDLQDYEDADSYDMLQRAYQESNGARVHQLFTDSLEFLRELLTVVSVAAVLFSWNPWLAVLILVAPVPSAIAQMFYGKRMFAIEYERAADRRRLVYLQFLTTRDHSFKEIRLFRLGPFFLDSYRRLVRDFLRIDSAVARRQSVSLGLSGLLSVVTAAGAIVYALVSTVSSGEIGQLAGYLQAIGIVQASAHAMLLGIATIFQNAMFTSNLLTLFDLPPSRITGGSVKFPQRLSVGIEFRGVSFTYPGSTRPVLDGISFTLRPGECTALVGQNGAGKTTIVKLLTRLYEPTGGQILIDDVPIEHYDLDSLRSNLGVIFQDFVKYEMSARHNIGFGSLDHLTDDAAVRRAAEASGAAAMVEQFPAKYDTMLGRQFEEGVQLSGGQWQKIALARAFIRKAQVVVLDEPTAAIDAEAEAEVFQRLRQIAAGATSLLIAHRFSTVRIADQILVIENGRTIERGTHAELMAANGRYAHLFNLQAAGYSSEQEAA